MILTAAITPHPHSDEGLHRTLARWNARRLAPSLPQPDWRIQAREDADMILLEGEYVERRRAAAQPYLNEVPDDPEGFISWFESLKGTGPGENDPLFPWLAQDAPMAAMRWFLEQEVAGEAGFEDLVAYAQVKMPTRPKLELARNYWDEMGRGHEKGMHGPLLDRLARALDLAPAVDTTCTASLALGNLLVALSTTRRYAYHALGALGAVELTAPWRAGHVDAGLKRLGVGAERKYFALHATLDVEHSIAWNAEVIRPLIDERPACARALAEGAVMRLMAGADCFAAYRQSLWATAGARRSAG